MPRNPGLLLDAQVVWKYALLMHREIAGPHLMEYLDLLDVKGKHNIDNSKV